MCFHAAAHSYGVSCCYDELIISVRTDRTQTLFSRVPLFVMSTFYYYCFLYLFVLALSSGKLRKAAVIFLFLFYFENVKRSSLSLFLWSNNWTVTTRHHQSLSLSSGDCGILRCVKDLIFFAHDFFMEKE